MALTNRYVTVAGAGAHDGTSEANAFTWAEMLTDLNTPRAGYKYLIKSGTYSLTTTIDAPTGDGNATSPNVIEGYSSTEGDLLSSGRDSNGALVTTNFPEITYTTGKLNLVGSQFLVIRCLSITAAATSATVTLGVSSLISTCDVTSTGSGASSQAIAMTTPSNPMIRNCDVETTGGSATAAISSQSGSAVFIGNRVKCPSGAGLKVRGSGATYVKNTIYGCVNGIHVDSSSASPNILDNTIVNCTGDGILLTTGTTETITIMGNHITGNGGYGINYQTSTCVKKLGFNRFRDNTSGSISGGGDWEEGTSVNNVTSDDTDETDFADQANDNYSLLNTAPAITAGVGYRNPIGAHGASSFGGSGGGGTSRLINGGLVRRLEMQR